MGHSQGVVDCKQREQAYIKNLVCSKVCFCCLSGGHAKWESGLREWAPCPERVLHQLNIGDAVFLRYLPIPVAIHLNEITIRTVL